MVSGAGDDAREAVAAGFSVEFVPWTWERFDEAAALRYEVLHGPFGVAPSDDWHDDDPESEHLVAVASDETIVGYARLITRGNEVQIRQVAVAFDWQRSGVGSALMQALVSEALSRGPCHIWLNARLHAISFYERLGFEAVGDVFTTGQDRPSTPADGVPGAVEGLRAPCARRRPVLAR